MDGRRMEGWHVDLESGHVDGGYLDAGHLDPRNLDAIGPFELEWLRDRPRRFTV